MERLIDLVFKLINKQGQYYVVVEIIDFLPVQIPNNCHFFIKNVLNLMWINFKRFEWHKKDT